MVDIKVHDGEYNDFNGALKAVIEQSLAERLVYQSKLDQITMYGLISGNQAENIRTFALQTAMINIDIDRLAERLSNMPSNFVMKIDVIDRDIYV